MRIYELLKQYRKIGERLLSIAELRDMYWGSGPRRIPVYQ